jgi:hypothetical protein
MGRKKRPEIMLYFNENQYSLENPEEAEQIKAVLNFKKKIRGGGEALYKEYKGLEDFKSKVESHLHSFILKYKREKEPNVDQPPSIYDLEVQKKDS